MEELKKSKRGERYTKNPFIVTALANTKVGIRKISNKGGDQMMVVSQNTGEIIGPAGFWQIKEVDETQFVKLYVNGVKEFKNLTGAGVKVFEILYNKVQENFGKDELWLTFPTIDQNITPMGETTFYRGMKELLEKGFIAESMAPGLYYINPDFIWNGDRLGFVKEYYKAPKKSKALKKDTQTLNLFNDLESDDLESQSD